MFYAIPNDQNCGALTPLARKNEELEIELSS